MNTVPSAVIETLAAWREKATSWASITDTVKLTVLASALNEVERAIHAAEESSVNLRQAAKLSGYSSDHLGKLVRAGTLENVGRYHAPRIRVRDLPHKAGPLPDSQPRHYASRRGSSPAVDHL